MRSYISIICAFIIWGTWGPVIRWLDKPAAVIVFYSALFALAFQGAGLVFSGRRQKPEFGRELGTVLFIGLCGIINTLTFFYAFRVTTVAAALLTHYTAPVFVAVIAPFFLKDRMSAVTLGALVLSLTGLALVFVRGIGPTGAAGLIGAVSGTVSGLAYALVIIFSRSISARHNPLKIPFVQGVLTLAALGAYVYGKGEYGITLGQGLVFLCIGFFHSTLANFLYLCGIRGVTAQEAGVLGYVEPVLGILLAFIFLGERPHALALAGGALIIASGLAVVIRGGRLEAAGGLNDNRR